MNKSMKPAGFAPKIAPAQRPLTEEEKKIKVMQILQQKREQFAINILCHLVEGNENDKDAFLIGKAVSLADALIEKLYPMPETKTEE